MKAEETQKFLEILKSFDTGMLVTRRGSELRSRPMAVAGQSDEGHVWFITNVDSGKIEELTEKSDVNVTMQAASKFLSISGKIRVTRDTAKRNELWQEKFSVWFEKGKDDPALVLLEVVPTYAEYWDRSGANQIGFIWATAKSAVTGETLSNDAIDHSKLDFPRTRDTSG